MKVFPRLLCSVSLVLIAMISINLVGCGGGGGGGGSVTGNEYLGTQSPGDVWNWTIGVSEFSAENETLGYTYSGDVEQLGNGFLKLTISSTTDTGASSGDVAYALEYPEVALLVKPDGEDSDVIVCAGQGALPTSDASYNYVNMPHDAWTESDEVWGVAESTVNGTNFTFDLYKWLITNTTPAHSSEELGLAFTGSAGRLDANTGDTTIAITPAGVFIGDNGPNSGGFVGVEAPASDMGTTTIFQEDHQFLGVLFKDGSTDPDEDDTEPIWASIDSSAGNYLAGGSFDGSDFENATPGDESVRLTISSEIQPGVFSGQLTDYGTNGIYNGGTDDDSVSDFCFLMNEINGKYFIFGISLDGYSDKPYNFLVIEQ